MVRGVWFHAVAEREQPDLFEGRYNRSAEARDGVGQCRPSAVMDGCDVRGAESDGLVFPGRDPPIGTAGVLEVES